MQFKSEVFRDVLVCVLANFCIAVAPIVLSFLALPMHMLTPLPSLFYRSKLGRQYSLNAFLLTVPLIYIIFGGISSAFFSTIVLISLGLILGELFERSFTIEATVLISCCFVVLFLVSCLFCYSFQTKIGILSLLSGYIDKNISDFLQICRDSNVSGEIITILEERKENIVNFVTLIFPSSIIMTIIITVWMNIIIVKPLMLRNNIKYPNFGCLSSWCAPEGTIWGLIGCSSALLTGNKFFWSIGINGLLVLIVVYFLQGIAIVTFYLKKKKASLFLKIVTYSVIFLNHFVLMIIVGVGIFDMWFNFRKLRKPN